jgi:hypothetical protein
MNSKEGRVIIYDESNSRTVKKTDSIVDSIVDKFIDRARVGKDKYGTNLDRQDLGLYDWCEHAIQESMDLILYLRKIQKTIDPNK